MSFDEFLVFGWMVASDICGFAPPPESADVADERRKGAEHSDAFIHGCGSGADCTQSDFILLIGAIYI